ncbi:MAG: DNA-binding protein WhiA [Corynebacterium sp.]|nr:DNA-binding protein WhiA [Corynebacterium sp.]
MSVERSSGDLSAEIKQELVGVQPPNIAAAYSEIAALLRLGAEYSEARPGQLSLQATFDDFVVAQRLQSLVQSAFHIPMEIADPSVQEMRKNPRFQVSMHREVKDMLRKLGLLTSSGYATEGMPQRVVNGRESDHAAAWRGAFLVSGSVAAPGRTASLEIECPNSIVSLAFTGCARQLGVSAKRKDSRGREKVVVREADNVGALLSRIGAHYARAKWDLQAEQAQPINVGQRLANFDDANQRRSARAAADSAARIGRAMEILGDEIPEQLLQAGLLRLQHQDASLEALGRLADPPVTKDAVAGRIRRLLGLADRRAEELGIAKTNAALEHEKGK